MAFSIQITQARQCAVGLGPAPASASSGSYLLVVDDCVQATVGGMARDLLVGGAQQRVSQPVTPGHPMLTPAQVAALIRQDGQAVFGGQPDRGIIDGAAL